jgi:prepilin-type processing-associated H-X9-DG protein/prepilin-type N-terminal cleavage/methylation domain-containing protein
MRIRYSMATSGASRRQWRRLAFTLTELLVTLAVIGILAALLTLVLGRARRSAQNAVCLGNLKQVGAAALLYASDNKGYLPVAGSTSDSGNHWQRVLYEGGYIGDYRATLCPSLMRSDDDSIRPNVLPAKNQGYGMRMWIGGSAVSLVQIDAVNWPYVADSVNMAGYGEPQQIRWLTGSNNSDNDNVVDRRHGGKANVLFADGHVSAMDQAGLTALNSSSFRYSRNTQP